MQALGLSGSGLGYASLPSSLAVEFDMHQDTKVGDPNDNHVSIHAAGFLANAADEVPPVGVSECSGGLWYRLLPGPSLKDSNQHKATVEYVGGRLLIYVDNDATPALACTVDFNLAMGVSCTCSVRGVVVRVRCDLARV